MARYQKTFILSLVALCLALAFVPAALATHGGAHGTGDGTETTGDGTETTNPSTYLSNLYLWFLGFVGIAALFAIVYGGVLWMFSTSLTSTGEARKWITNAIFGIVLAAASFLILNIINPDLVQGFDLNTIIDKALE
ncbi:MAG: hypothetical protein A3B37_01320 [Candidatus Sungbacteria bacterium RIFCSPLOWO2_01_FULL_59_16]|uniref:Uncharacterized protein n=1 Tax=Candidatus Sungbacteria bacterium RIFCSPLOWO2_01_FULL_59_16 TaxID=1802280 RepID=A0A1G2LC91_9BACT|nr:MAG: hypothetical protein A3B37_01320 [Candidatus Sungbacteria bacterium RIFCSPLOWO2_01_FULL_59_16]